MEMNDGGVPVTGPEVGGDAPTPSVAPGANSSAVQTPKTDESGPAAAETVAAPAGDAPEGGGAAGADTPGRGVDGDATEESVGAAPWIDPGTAIEEGGAAADWGLAYFGLGAAPAMEVEAGEAAATVAGVEDAGPPPAAAGDEPPPPPPATPQELHERIEASRDRLFFIAYAHSQDPHVAETASRRRSRGAKKKVTKKRPDFAWYLVRVDLSTTLTLDEAKDCRDTGRYYVEFFTKASYDRGVRLPGHPLEDGVPAAEMKPRPDSTSRYWLAWHEYRVNKRGEMVMGKGKELLPNSRKAVHRRLQDLAEETARAGDPATPEIDRHLREGERKLVWEYHPDFGRHTTWADVMDLSDPAVRLVGPFDFEDVQPPAMMDDDLRAFDAATRERFRERRDDLWVRERVPRGRWEELRRALAGKDVAPPTFAPEDGARGRKRRGKAAAPAPAARKRARGDGAARGTQPFLRFPAAASRPSLAVREVGGEGEPAVLSKRKLQEDMRAVVEGALERTRHAVGADRKIYYALGEFQGAMEEALGAWARGRGLDQGAV